MDLIRCSLLIPRHVYERLAEMAFQAEHSFSLEVVKILEKELGFEHIHYSPGKKRSLQATAKKEKNNDKIASDL